ncbi:hypothetical protein [Nocardiopsis sp. CA-288880]|uniref:hypothetical protein n=1 Tax=Nocardiopsis sp. CA-288880 TaxID=3239995 RepID=UPI003D957ACD
MHLFLLDAWALWWSGLQLTDHTLHGAPVLWSGRLGKLPAFLAGTTTLLDVIGPARLMTWGRALRAEREGPYFIVGLLGVVLLGLLLLHGPSVVAGFGPCRSGPASSERYASSRSRCSCSGSPWITSRPRQAPRGR